MSMTPAEQSRLKVAILEQLYPLAIGMKLSSSQVVDLAERCEKSGKLFLTSQDKLTGWDVPELVETLRADPANAHVFKTTAPADEKKPAATGDDFHKRFGMSKAAFDALPARRRLELVNKGSCQ